MILFLFQLFSPKGILFSEEVESVTLYSTSSTVTILAHHAPLVTTFMASTLIIKTKEHQKVYYLEDGWLETFNNQTSVGVVEAIPAQELDKEKIQAQHDSLSHQSQNKDTQRINMQWRSIQYADSKTY